MDLMNMNGPANVSGNGGKRQSLICPKLNERMDMIMMNGPANDAHFGGRRKSLNRSTRMMIFSSNPIGATYDL